MDRRNNIDTKSSYDSYYSSQNYAPWLQNQPQQIQPPHKSEIHATELPVLSRIEENVAVPQQLVSFTMTSTYHQHI